MFPVSLRVLEISDSFHFKRSWPEQTTLLWRGHRTPPPSLAYADCTPLRLCRELRAASRGEYDLIVASAYDRAPWAPLSLWKSWAATPWRPVSASTRLFGAFALGFAERSVPLVVIDMSDRFTIDKANFRLLDKSDIYFKRELPVDAWQALYGEAHPNLVTSRIRRSARWRRRLAKLQPISLQPAVVDVGAPEQVFARKTTDIFFAGDTMNSTVRLDGLRQLERLAQRGVNVDIADGRLDHQAYFARMSRAWLAWSPSGRGWDCYRHYEAPQCLAVPVINYPTIRRYEPLQHGAHAIYYAPEGDGLVEAVVNALADKPALMRMALAGRDHVRQHHAGRAFCYRILKAVRSHLAARAQLEGACQ